MHDFNIYSTLDLILLVSYVCRYIAIEKDNIAVVQALLSIDGADVNAAVTREASKMTALHVAVLYRRHAIAELLVWSGADVDAVEEEHGFTPIMTATIFQDAWTVELLLTGGASLESRSKEGKRALYMAIEKGNSGIVRQLLTHSIQQLNEPTTGSHNQEPPLHLAALFDHTSILILLLKLGADIGVKDNIGRTCMDVAREAGSRESIALLESLFDTVTVT